jgi:hypothetical protein
LKAKLARLYGPVFDIKTLKAPLSKSTNADQAANGKDEGAPETREEEFEFRLFAVHPTSKSANEGKDVLDGEADVAVTTKIRLDPDGEEPLDGQGGFIVPCRSSTYYFALPAEGQRRREFELAAVTGEEVHRWLEVRYPGWEVPWRVRVIHIPSKKPSAETKLRLRDKNDASRITSMREDNQYGLENDEYKGKKKKPGKKRRIHLRMKKRAEEEVRERRRREQQMKGEEERERRTRRNREKKVKKKLREKAKKTSSSERSGDGMVGNGADAGNTHAGGVIGSDYDDS